MTKISIKLSSSFYEHQIEDQAETTFLLQAIARYANSTKSKDLSELRELAEEENNLTAGTSRNEIKEVGEALKCLGFYEIPEKRAKNCFDFNKLAKFNANEIPNVITEFIEESIANDFQRLALAREKERY